MRGSLLLVLALPGCASYRPEPLDPAKSAEGLEARRLEDPSGAWDLDRLAREALRLNPEMEQARARVAVAAAAGTSASALPNPSFSFAPSWNADAVTPDSPWALAWLLEIPLEIAGKRGARMEEAKALSEAAQLELGEAAWKVRSRLRSALAGRLLAERDLALARAGADLRGDLAQAAERRRVPLLEAASARSDLGRSRQELSLAEGRLAESRAALAAALGLPVRALDGVALSWPGLDRPPEAFALGLLDRLDLRKALADYAVSEAALKSEVAKQWPDLRLGPGFTWDQGSRKFQLGLSFTLPLLNRNEGPIAEAEARRKEAAERVLAVQARALAEREAGSARYAAALEAFREAGAAEDSLRGGTAADALVRGGILLRRLEAARARLDALRRLQEALGALEDAVQRPLP